MVRSLVVEPTHQDSSPRLRSGGHSFLDLFQASDDVCSLGGDVPVDYEGICGDFVNLKMTGRLSLSKVLIGVGCACVHRGECVCICMSVCVCTMLRKKHFYFGTTRSVHTFLSLPWTGPKIIMGLLGIKPKIPSRGELANTTRTKTIWWYICRVYFELEWTYCRSFILEIL